MYVTFYLIYHYPSTLCFIRHIKDLVNRADACQWLNARGGWLELWLGYLIAMGRPNDDGLQEVHSGVLPRAEETLISIRCRCGVILLL